MIATCSWCGTDADVEHYDEAADLALCTGAGHPGPRMFEPKAERAARKAKAKALAALTDGIAARLGLYDDLPPLLVPGEWAETGVIEYRYAVANPEGYAWMLDRWGHVSQGPRHYSTTTFIGSTLGQLSRATNITYKEGNGSGWAKGSRVGFWAMRPLLDEMQTVTWSRFSEASNIDRDVWPFA